jgi:hypothetical protein
MLLAAGAVVIAACSDDTTGAETNGPDYVLLLDDDSMPDQVQGEPGTYALTARGSGTPPLAVLDVPAGYSNFGFFALGPDVDAGIEPFRAVQYWTVDGVFVDPCAMDEDAPYAGTTVEDLAAALAAQKRSAVSPPSPVTLDGHPGLYLELTASPDVAFEDCAGGYYAYWEGRPDDAQHTADSPGTVDRAWILDVDGERVVITAINVPEVPDQQVDELTAMVESVRFVGPE